jgi:signal peptidase
MKALLRRHGGLALTLMLIGAWALFLRPVGLLGGPADYIIVSGSSMEPTYQSGDLIVTRATNTYSVGDVITYRIPAGEPGEGTAIIHRIVDGTSSGYVTQGDNRDGVDPWNPAIPDVVGKTWIRIPEAGNIILFLLQPQVVAALAGGLTTLLILLRLDPDHEAELLRA